MKRRIFNVLLLSMFSATVVLWTLSYWRAMGLVHVTGGETSGPS